MLELLWTGEAFFEGFADKNTNSLVSHNHGLQPLSSSADSETGEGDSEAKADDFEVHPQLGRSETMQEGLANAKE